MQRVREDDSADDSAKHLAAILLLALVSFIGPAIVAYHYRALGAARGDDWSYLRTLFHWVDTGHLNFNNWVSMTLIGQLVIAAPVALVRHRDIASVQLLSGVLGFGGMLAVLWLGRIVTRRQWLAISLALCVAGGPLWGTLATTFMTDVPAFALTMLSVALGVRALRAEVMTLAAVFAALAAGFAAFTIREYAAVPLIALVIIVARRLHAEGRRRELTMVLAVALALCFAAVALVLYLHTVPESKTLRPGIPTGHTLSNLFYKGSGLPRMLGLWLLPAIVAARPVQIVRRAWRASADTMVFFTVGVSAWLLYTGFHAPRVAFAGNYFVPDGVLGRDVSAGHRPDLIPMGWFEALMVLGTAGAVLLFLAAFPTLVELAGRMRRRDLAPRETVSGYLALCVTGYTAAYALASATGLPLYDRYVLPMIPLIGLLLLRAPTEPAATLPARRAPTMIGAAAALALVCGLGLLYTVDSASFDGTRWHVAVAATRAGWKPRQVGGNFEWVNFYAAHSGSLARRKARFCVAVILEPWENAAVANRTVVASATYHQPFHRALTFAAVVHPGKECAAQLRATLRP